LLKGLPTLMVCRPENQGLRERMNLLEDLKEFDEGAKGCVPVTWSDLIHIRGIYTPIAYLCFACKFYYHRMWGFCGSLFAMNVL
jgi:hypothetical protein